MAGRVNTSISVAGGIHSRDAFGAKVISQLVSTLPLLNTTSLPTDEYVHFWCIVGLIESHQLAVAESLIRNFKPKEIILLLALHMGCYAVQHLHVTDIDDKKLAKRICDYLQPKVKFMMPDVLNELKSLLVEVRHGEIKAIDVPKRL